jgi:hypothetical protein
MGSWPPVGDEGLVTELGEALRDEEAVPDDHRAAARFAYAWRTAAEELAIAELMFDSACDPEPAGPTRSAAGARALSFRSGPVLVELEVTDDGIVGQLSPASAGRVLARTATGVYDRTQVGPVGYFSLGVPPSGPVRICAYTAEFSVATAWVTLA